MPFAREVSGISIRGDAWTWWNAASGQYDRGQVPRIGAVVVFKKFAAMRHGHVAVVARVVNSREVLVDHANWAPHRGRGRGKVSKMVAVTDVSPANDWSEVRVWNSSTRDFGTRTYPTYGFIYPVPRGGYVQQASSGMAADHPARHLNAASDSVLATADQQIAAVLAEEFASAGASAADLDDPIGRAASQPETRSGAEGKGAKAARSATDTGKPAEVKPVDAKPVDAKAIETRSADAKSGEAGRTRNADAGKTVVAMAPGQPPLQVDGVWEGDSAAAKMAGAGSY